VSGVFYFAPYFWQGGFAELDAFRSYLLAQLLVDADQTVDVLKEQFVEAYYGPAAGAVGAYLEAMMAAGKGARCAPGVFEAPLFLDVAALRRATEAFDRLEVEGMEEPYRLRARRAAAPLGFVRLFGGAVEAASLRFSCAPDAADVEAYVGSLQALGECAPLETSLVPLGVAGEESVCRRMLAACGPGAVSAP
jgi:hypothetical protein